MTQDKTGQDQMTEQSVSSQNERALARRLRRAAIVANALDPSVVGTLSSVQEAKIRAAMEVVTENMVPATWDGLLTILEAHYPEDVFDGSSGDPGAHIVALCRAIERLATFIEEQIPGSQVYRASGMVVT